MTKTLNQLNELTQAPADDDQLLISDTSALEDKRNSYANFKAPLEAAINQRTIYVGSVAELESLSLAAGTNAYLTEDGRAGNFVVKSGTPLNDPKKGIYVVLANGNYAERQYNGVIEARWFGVSEDNTNNSPELQAALDFGGIIKLPRGTLLFDEEMTVYSNTTVIGSGRDYTTLAVTSNLPLEDSLFRSIQGVSGPNQRDESNIHFKDMGFDGSGRVYILYPNAGFETKGNIIKLVGVVDCSIYNIKLFDHQSIGVSIEGCKRFTADFCEFYRCGKEDDISSPLQTVQRGTLRKITGIPNTNPALIRIDGSTNLVEGQDIYIKDVEGLELPSGIYQATNITNDTFEINFNATGLNSFSQTLKPYYLHTGTTTEAAITEDVKVTNCFFYNNKRSGISLGGKNLQLTNNQFENNGESTVFCTRSWNVNISNNIIQETNITDIVAAGVEINTCYDFNISENSFERTATEAIIVIGGVSGRIMGNSFNNIIKDADINYPVGPLSVAAGIDGTPIKPNKTGIIRISNIVLGPIDGLQITDNTFVDGRNTAQATQAIDFAKAGFNNRVRNVTVKNNLFELEGLTDKYLIGSRTVETTNADTITISGNHNHPSEAPVYMEHLFTSVSDQFFYPGFVPRAIKVHAIHNTAQHERYSDGSSSRRSDGTIYQRCYSYAIDNLAGTITTARDTTSTIINVIDANGVSRLNASITDAVIDGIGCGVKFSVNTFNDEVLAKIEFYP